MRPYITNQIILLDPCVNSRVHGGAVMLWLSLLAQFHAPKPELKFCTSSNPACGMSGICDDENPQKQFIIINHHHKFRPAHSFVGLLIT